MLLERKDELEKALASTKFPLEVASSCLGYRESRIGVDMVHDDVEIGLVKVKTIPRMCSAVNILQTKHCCDFCLSGCFQYIEFANLAQV